MYSGGAKLSESSTATVLGSTKTEKMKDEGAEHTVRIPTESM